MGTTAIAVPAVVNSSGNAASTKGDTSNDRFITYPTPRSDRIAALTAMASRITYTGHAPIGVNAVARMNATVSTNLTRGSSWWIGLARGR